MIASNHPGYTASVGRYGVRSNVKHYLVDGVMVTPDLPDVRRRLEKASRVIAVAPDGSRELLKDRHPDKPTIRKESK